MNLCCLAREFLLLILMGVASAEPQLDNVHMDCDQLKGSSPTLTVLVHLTALPRGLGVVCFVLYCSACILQKFCPPHPWVSKILPAHIYEFILINVSPGRCDALWSPYLCFNQFRKNFFLCFLLCLFSIVWAYSLESFIILKLHLSFFALLPNTFFFNMFIFVLFFCILGELF